MACPTCDHTMQKVGVMCEPYTEVGLFWCNRCGTLVTEEDDVPKLVSRITEFAGKLTDKHQDLIDEFERLGIRESIMVDSGMVIEGESVERPKDSPLAFTDLLTALRDEIAEIVIPDGEDAGVILLSDDSPSDWNETVKCHVYRHMYFSPLGDALVALWQRVDNAAKELEMEERMMMLEAKDAAVRAVVNPGG